MRKKLLSTLLAAALAAGMLAGCGGKTEEATKTEEGAAASSGDMVNINVTRCTFNLANPDSEQVKKVEDAINAYIADKINVQITLTDLGSGEFVDKANLALQNGEINLLWTAAWEGTIGTNDLVPQKSVYDITDLLPGTALYESMDASQWEASQYDGRNYFIPVYKDNVEGYDICFRQDLIDQFGWDITAVKSLADLEPMLADAKAEGIKYPFLLQKVAMFYRFYIDSFDFFTADATSNWISVDRDTDSVVATVTTPEYAEFCSLMGKWAEMGYVSEDEVTKTTPDTAPSSQDWAITWWTDIPVNDEADARYNQDVTMQPLTARWAHSTSALGSCYCITANSTEEQAKACIDFMGLLYTDSKLADLYTFGIEGEDFTYENNKVVQASDKYNHSMWESASATVVTPLANEPDNKAELFKEFNGSAQASCAAGFRFDKTPVEAQYASCQSIYEQYGFPLENGGFAEADVPATIEAYQTALDEAGFQDVLAEFTAQYDAWKAAK